LLVTLAELRAAQDRLRGVAMHTPLVSWEGSDLWIKAEGLQPIGSFKLRGAFNKIVSCLPPSRPVASSPIPAATMLRGLLTPLVPWGIKAVIVMPSNAPVVKVNATRALGAEIVTVGQASLERKAKAEELAATFGYVVIPPYDDRDIIAGQGTLWSGDSCRPAGS
jgi:threonine dehydratase